MKGTRPVVLALALAVAASAVAELACAGEASPPDRRRAAAEASEAFLRTHLFSEGRGMHVSPGMSGLWRAVPSNLGPFDLTREWAATMGFVPAGRGTMIGVFETEAEGARLLAVGCAACHVGRAAGRTHVGLGNKSIDVGVVGGTLGTFAIPDSVTRALRPPAQRRLVEQSTALASLLTDARWTNRTRGLVPAAMIASWFYRRAGAEFPADLHAGAVKPPHLWGYEPKRAVGLFCDGFGSGQAPGWAAAVELAAGQTPEGVRRYAHRLEEIEALLYRFLPPVYPFPVDLDLARRGREVFEQTCATCHGSYRRDEQGLPIFEAPRHVAWDVVRTDRDRADAVTPELRAHVASSPVADLLAATDLPHGYFSPRLDGAWARFAYLHNASVPTLRAMLTPPARRPLAWSLSDAGERNRFDTSAVGYTLPAPGSPQEAALLRRADSGDRDVYSVRRPGHGNGGHDFGTSLPDSDKSALLEYLKTL